MDGFQDPRLDALELQVNLSNQNLKAAEAQFQQARATLHYDRADYLPNVTAGSPATRTRVPTNRPGSTVAGRTYNDFVLPFDGHRITRSSSRWRVGPLDSAAETRMLRQAREQHNGN